MRRLCVGAVVGGVTSHSAVSTAQVVFYVPTKASFETIQNVRAANKMALQVCFVTLSRERGQLLTCRGGCAPQLVEAMEPGAFAPDLSSYVDRIREFPQRHAKVCFAAAAAAAATAAAVQQRRWLWPYLTLTFAM
jgi:hypothetical protein